MFIVGDKLNLIKKHINISTEFTEKEKTFLQHSICIK